MCSRNKTILSTNNYWDSVKEAAALIQNAGSVVVGVGSGLSAAGGLNYSDPRLLQKWFPEYAALGFHGLFDVAGRYWTLSQSKPERYWGYWAKHIWHIRYETKALPPYQELFRLLDGKSFFLCSTNVDGQLEKAGFPKEKIFAPQGDYALFQCSKPCSQEVYPNREQILSMVQNMPSPLEIRTEDIPLCPHCGAPLIPNLRCDDLFVEKPHLVSLPDYEAFLQKGKKGRLVLLELGVGFNTPGIIRYPFERIVREASGASLIRVNLDFAGIPKEITGRGLSFQDDIAKVLSDLAAAI